jgi:hypothetical protein
MPALTDLDHAVDELLDTALVRPTDASVVMARGRARIRSRRAVGVAALATTVAVAAAVVVVNRPTRDANVRIKTRDEPTTTAVPTTTVAPIDHVSPAGQFTATALPAGWHLQDLEVFPARDGGPASVMAGYGDDTEERISVLAVQLRAGETPESVLAGDGHSSGTPQHFTLDGRPAVVTHSLERPEVPFLGWVVDGWGLQIGGQNGTPVDQLTPFALGLRAASVSQPPGMYVVRGGVLVPNVPGGN